MAHTSIHDELKGDEFLVARTAEVEDGTWLILIVDSDTEKVHGAGVECTRHAAERWGIQCIKNIALGLEEPPDAYERTN